MQLLSRVFAPRGALSIFLCSLLICVGMAAGTVGVMALTGCNKSQVVNVINELEQQLPQVAQMATGLALLVSPEYAPLISPGAAVIASDGKLLESLITGFNPASPNPTTLQKINAVWADIQNNLQAIVTAVGVKDATSAGYVNFFAGFVQELAVNIVALVKSGQTTTTAMLERNLPAVFGFHLAGVDMVAFEREISSDPAAPAPSTTTPGKPHFSARDVAKHWNKLCAAQPKAKIPVPRAHFLGIPVPFTGHK